MALERGTPSGGHCIKRSAQRPGGQCRESLVHFVDGQFEIATDPATRSSAGRETPKPGPTRWSSTARDAYCNSRARPSAASCTSMSAPISTTEHDSNAPGPPPLIDSPPPSRGSPVSSRLTSDDRACACSTARRCGTGVARRLRLGSFGTHFRWSDACCNEMRRFSTRKRSQARDFSHNPKVRGCAPRERGRRSRSGTGRRVLAGAMKAC